MSSQWEKIGTIGVDAGLCWVGDPCYVMGDEASHRVRDWGKFCEATYKTGNEDDSVSAPLGEGIGFSISTGYGDGKYPVYIKRDDRGRIAQIKVKFI